MRNNRRWTRTTICILIIVCTVLVTASIVPIVVYFVVKENRSSGLRESSNPQASPGFSRDSMSGIGSQIRTSTMPFITASTTGLTRIPTTTSTTSLTTSTSTFSSIGSTVPTQDLDEVNRELLLRHNELRSLHGVPNMTWNSELTQFATNYAANNFSCDNVQLIHSGGSYGENLAAGYVGGQDPTNAWYNEIELYDYQNPGFTEETGHFTQLIWNDSVELGCAIVMCDNAWRQYTICEYYPRGNIVGSTNALTREIFTEHVRPLLDP